MQESGPLQTDIDECRLHSRQDPDDAPEIDIADQPATGGTFDMQLLHGPLIDHGNPGFLRRKINEDIF